MLALIIIAIIFVVVALYTAAATIGYRIARNFGIRSDNSELVAVFWPVALPFYVGKAIANKVVR